MTRPLGRVALMAHDVMTPAELLTVGAILAAVLLVKVLFSGLYSKVPGATSLMVMVTVAELEPPELFAQIL